MMWRRSAVSCGDRLAGAAAATASAASVPGRQRNLLLHSHVPASVWPHPDVKYEFALKGELD